MTGSTPASIDDRVTGHHHSHDGDKAAGYGRAFAIGVVLNSGFVLVEAAFGVLSGSMALIADAGHNLSDVLGLLIAWGAAIMAARPANARFTYGYKASAMLAALANAGLLLIATGAILFETIQRLFDPEPDRWAFEAWLSQLGWIGSLGHEGGLFVMVGRRQAQAAPPDASEVAAPSPPVIRAIEESLG